MKKKILVICPFPEGIAAGQRFKYEQFFKEWNKNNYDVHVSSFMNKKFFEVAYKPGHFFIKFYGVLSGYFKRIFYIPRLSQYDIVYVFMWIAPFGFNFFEKIYRFFSKKIIYDLEDNIISKNNEFSIRNFLSASSKIIYLIKNSDHVITSSPFLNNACLKINKLKKCTYISASINIKKFKEKKNNNKQITLGWTGTFSSRKYLESIKPILIELNKIIKFRLIIISNFIFHINSIDNINISWNKKTEVRDLHKIDIGLYPLFNNKWSDGKSGLKALQYMSIGIPVVATDTMMNRKIIDNKKNGYLVKNKKEWIYYLKKLILDKKLRNKIGKNSRKLIIQKYSTTVISDKYLDIIKKI